MAIYAEGGLPRRPSQIFRGTSRRATVYGALTRLKPRRCFQFRDSQDNGRIDVDISYALDPKQQVPVADRNKVGRDRHRHVGANPVYNQGVLQTSIQQP